MTTSELSDVQQKKAALFDALCNLVIEPELALRRLNSHAALLAVCEAFVAEIDNTVDVPTLYIDVYNKARAAIASAKGVGT